MCSHNLSYRSPKLPLARDFCTAASSSSRHSHALVLGGNGFVGRQVCQELMRKGFAVHSLNRSGSPALEKEWMSSVDWIKGDSFQIDSQPILDQVGVVVSCVASFGPQEFMERICGDATVVAAQAAAKRGVSRFVFISAHHTPLAETFLSGYYKGKAKAERAVFELFGANGYALRPPMIYGYREVSPLPFPLPLGLVGAPLAALLSLPAAKALHSVPFLKDLSAPPVSVQEVGRTAAAAAAGELANEPNVLDVWKIKEIGARN